MLHFAALKSDSPLHDPAVRFDSKLEDAPAALGPRSFSPRLLAACQLIIRVVGISLNIYSGTQPAAVVVILAVFFIKKCQLFSYIFYTAGYFMLISRISG